MGIEFKHPADEIANALSRANGILTVIGGCYDKTGNQFAIGTAYIAESIYAVDGLLNAATTALERLYQTCDLTVVRDASEIHAPEAAVEVPAETYSTLPDLALPTPMPRAAMEAPQMKSSYLAAFGPSEAQLSLSERADSAVSHFKPMAPSKRETILDQPATTYEELLAKVTAVADQAAFQAHNSPTERSLLPALEGLRADLLKMRSAA
ncbi:MAG: hypothetical protein ABI230_00950 [Aestuariivirga sp.]